MDCYLLYYRNKIYRKDIDQQDPDLLADVFCWSMPKGFNYLHEQQSLIVSKDSKISAVSLETKEIEIVSFRSIGECLRGFEFVGGEGCKQKFVSLTGNNYILLNELYFEKKVGYVTGNFKLRVDKELGEVIENFAVCSQNRYVLLDVAGFEKKSPNLDPVYHSRMVMLEIQGSTLVQKGSTVVKSGARELRNEVLKCCGYSGSGRHIIWLGLTSGDLRKKEDGLIQLYDYDTETCLLRETKGRRLATGSTLRRISTASARTSITLAKRGH